jgi:FkbH-like protein
VKLAEAFELLQAAPTEGPLFSVALACGFTPLHLQTFLTAHLSSALPGRRVEVRTGLFGDLAGTLERMSGSEVAAVAIAIEWADLDPRLGYRSLGGWGRAQQTEIARTVTAALDRLQRAIEQIPGSIPVALSLPTLPMAPAFHTAGWQTSAEEFLARREVMSLAVEAGKRVSIKLVNESRLPPAAERMDLRADLLTGFPYTVRHADALGEALARLIQPQPPKKGLITDLDGTLWSGMAGEIGPDRVSWDGSNQLHGLYQQLLQALAEEGVLIAVASKNDPATVEQALRRDDLLLHPERVFPIEAHWEAKSKSVARILQAWNIGADSVVFIDDSPMELAEVKAAWPEIECLPFPAGDHAAADALFRRLRDLFGKSRISEEDSLRMASLRACVGHQGDSFLAQAEAKMTIEFDPPAEDLRVLELVNKTNQFNLNGRRYTEQEWRKELAGHPDADRWDAFVMAVSYQDRFGPLGKIAVMRGRSCGGAVDVDTWVMSCRAFSRRIEHRCLEILFERFGAEEIRLQFAVTSKNSPLREMLAQYVDGSTSISRERFLDRAPKLYQEVEFVQNSRSAASMRSLA